MTLAIKNGLVCDHKVDCCVQVPLCVCSLKHLRVHIFFSTYSSLALPPLLLQVLDSTQLFIHKKQAVGGGKTKGRMLHFSAAKNGSIVSSQCHIHSTFLTLFILKLTWGLSSQCWETIAGFISTTGPASVLEGQILSFILDHDSKSLTCGSGDTVSLSL